MFCHTDNSVWKEINNTIREKPPVSLRFQQIEDLFCMKPLTTSAIGARPGPAKQIAASLLNSKRSLAVNIFIKQFKCPLKDTVDAIRRCDTTLFNSEQLHGLQKILPDSEEVK